MPYAWRRIEGSVNFQWCVEYCYVVVKLFSTVSFNFPQYPIPLEAARVGMWWTYCCQICFFFFFSLLLKFKCDIENFLVPLVWNILISVLRILNLCHFPFCIFLIESLNLTFLLFSFLNLFPILFFFLHFLWTFNCF